MAIRRRVFLIVFCMCLISGCYEDEAQLTLNPDGSGILKQKVVISERLIVASSDSDRSENTPPVSKDKLLEEVGSAINVTSVKQNDLPDGGRIVEFEGTFSTPEQFFLSEFCQKTINLRLAPGGDGKAAIYCDMKNSTSGGPSLTQLYGAAKGLYIKRTVHLPVKIEKTNGCPGEADSTVSWIMDLRNQQGLAKAKAFIEGPDKGNGFAIFDASRLEFSLPLKAAALAEKPAPAEQEKVQEEYAGLAAKVSWVSLKKKMRTDGASTTEVSDLEIGIEVSWNEGHCPVGCKKPVLVSLLDDQNNDLVSDKGPAVFQSQIFSREKKNAKKELTLRAKTPSENARKLKHLEGYVEVITDVTKEVVVLENIKELAEKESTGNPILDRLNFRIKSIGDYTLKIEIDGGAKTLTSLNLIKPDGNKVRKSGSWGGGDEYSYNFSEEIPELAQCELEVVISENTVKVPFSLDHIPLP